MVMRTLDRSEGAYLLMAALDERRVTWNEVAFALWLWSGDPTMEQAQQLLAGTRPPERKPGRRRNRKRAWCDDERRWRRGLIRGMGKREHDGTVYAAPSYSKAKKEGEDGIGPPAAAGVSLNPRNQRVGSIYTKLLGASDEMLELVDSLLDGGLTPRG